MVLLFIFIINLNFILLGIRACCILSVGFEWGKRFAAFNLEKKLWVKLKCRVSYLHFLADFIKI